MQQPDVQSDSTICRIGTTVYVVPTRQMPDVTAGDDIEVASVLTVDGGQVLKSRWP